MLGTVHDAAAVVAQIRGPYVTNHSGTANGVPLLDRVARIITRHADSASERLGNANGRTSTQSASVNTGSRGPAVWCGVGTYRRES